MLGIDAIVLTILAVLAIFAWVIIGAYLNMPRRPVRNSPPADYDVYRRVVEQKPLRHKGF